MKPELIEALVDECKAAVEVSVPEGQAAINATARLIEGIAITINGFDKSFNHKDFLKKTLFPID